ncbi:MAG TPA: divergent polysaccharide deacetylase family protein [Methylomirabilota bacterium]|jgi:hypothetical protein|nr:divergent polysaccharide deacetylase family protein [Methylomirabilota bacterium]
MPARVWQALVGLIALLLVAVVGLDQWQARRGEASLFALSWPARPSLAPPSGERRPAVETLVPSRAPAGPRVAVVVDQMGGRREVFEALRDLRRPVTLAMLPALPQAAPIAREASRSGMEVLLDLPMEPYRYPQLDPGPGALLMSMPHDEIRRVVVRHLEALPGVVGVTNYMGSRLTEDRARMRAILEVLAARRLFLIDAYASNLSVAYDEAKEIGLRAARRQIIVDVGRGERGERAGWDEVAGWAERRGHVIVMAGGHPLTARVLREYVPRWEARGIRLVPVSELVR